MVTLSPTRQRAASLVRELQERFCDRALELERAGAARGDRPAGSFVVDAWESSATLGSPVKA